MDSRDSRDRSVRFAARNQLRLRSDSAGPVMRINSGPINPFKNPDADKITEGAGFSTTSQLISAVTKMIGSAVVDRKLKAAPKLTANAMNGIGSH